MVLSGSGGSVTFWLIGVGGGVRCVGLFGAALLGSVWHFVHALVQQ